MRGDVLERDGSALHAPMALRVDGAVVPPQAAELRTAFPQATGRLVVFLHGLMETEHAWWLAAQRSGGSYGDRLSADLGLTPVYVRYNSGRRIAENGRSLAGLLDALTDAWPVEVETIALVGHSMGGLVARSAAHQATIAELAWVGRVRQVIALGTPHLGAPLVQGAGTLAAVLGVLPETRPFAGLLNRASAGIHDLRVGCADEPLLEGATHCHVRATVTRSARHPVGRLVGDLLVLESSAAGRSRRRRIGLRPEDGLHVGGATHFALLNHPAVYDQLRRWLAPGQARAA
jgi:pimeloyl-ACP methyl ester carboxylesterase